MAIELDYQEITDNLIDMEILQERLSVGKVIMLRGNGRNILIGDGCLVKVNTSIGVSSDQSLNEEIEKLRSITSCSYSPDIIMDLSITNSRNKLYNVIPNFHSGPLGTLPHYRVHLGVSSFIKEEELFSIMEEQAASGVTFFTIHPTPTQELIALARQTRSTPFTSRGGGIIIRDMRIKKRDLNVFSENFDEILNLCKKYDVSLNIGTAFRPASIIDALDEVHTKELLEQKKYIDLAKKKGVRVAFEAVGHATLNHTFTHNSV
jgi:phosphomethylpyrimidine synthase